VYLIEVGERAVGARQVADGADWRDRPVHGIDGLEGNHLRASRLDQRKLCFKIGQIVVAPDALLAAAVADAGDHRCVVLFVGEDDAAGQQALQRGERRVVGNVGRGEKQRRRLGV